MNTSLFQRIKHRLIRMRLHPIRVFVFHHVSEHFDPTTMWECDWIRLDLFKKSMLELKKRYTFIPLQDAFDRLNKDTLRLKDYAVLTADDGWASLKNILPWLYEQQIPVTLFLNPSCLDGVHYHSRVTDQLLTENEILQITEKYRPFITIASHGWTHRNCTEMKEEEFSESVQRSETALKKMTDKIPFYAFVAGLSRPEQIDYLFRNALVPVFVDGMKNENGTTIIHRESLDGKTRI